MGAVVKAVAITAATSVIVVGIVMYVIYRVRGQQVKKKGSSFRREGAPRAEFRPHGAALKGVIVEEQGLDVLYLRQLHGSGCFNKVWYNPMMEDLKRMNPTLPHPIHETPLLLQQSTNLYEFHHNTTTTPPSPPLQPPPPPPPPPPIKAAPPPPPPPGPPKLRPAPPPQPAKKVAPSHKPPMAPRIKENRLSRGEADGVQTTKLKPLHWDKVMANSDHSMVWNEINDGSFRVDDELMEALFGYTSDHKSTAKNKIPSNQGSSTATQTFILEHRKSQNTAIILKSLPISRQEILDSLVEGRGLNADTLEKLTRICPTQEETTKILQFNGDPTKLADAESFLHHILTAVPTAFVRFNAMLFRANYDHEILHLKESLQACELGCKELRSGGIFFKLLEAILKAGNRMNAGTNRGNAQGFNLTALRRLSDVKSTDGKTTLLHFVVEQVVRSEGKRRLKKSETEEEAERECVMLGLQALESLNSEFSNVKKAAGVDYESLMSASSVLTARAGEIKVLLKGVEAEGFAVEMKGFLEECEAELRVVREEERRVVEVVKRTTVYYEMGLKGGNPLQLFVIVKDFLNNVEQVCWEMRKRLQKIKVGGASPTPRSPVKFENLQNYLKAQRVGTSWSDSDDDF